MKRTLILALILSLAFAGCIKKEQVNRPKVVVGLVIDQMRWDYLYRYYELYGNDGFKRLMNEGFNCQNTMISYLPSFTAPGHTCIYTGSVPALHGIAGNNWIDEKGKAVYCVDDESSHLVLGNTKAPSMSPKNLLTTTITDELRLATNQKSRVFGVAIKDRGSILPAGHLGNAAYFFNDSLGVFTTTSYYPTLFQNPNWLQKFNGRNIPDSLAKLNWKLLYPDNIYNQSSFASSYGKGFKGEKAPSFPHIIDTLGLQDRLSAVKTMPAGNTMTFMMAEACMEGEGLGKGKYTDFLAVSLSSPDYAGHQFGPNSLEVEDMYLRLDKEIADFLKYMDAHYGKDNYLIFLTADHGAAHNAIYLKDMDVPAEVSNYAAKLYEINFYLREHFKDQLHGKKPGTDDDEDEDDNSNNNSNNGEDAQAAPADSVINLVLGMPNYQVTLDNNLVEKLKLDRQAVKDFIMDWLRKQDGVSFVVDLEHMEKSPMPEPLKSMVVNGYYRKRSGCIQFILEPGWYDFGSAISTVTTGTTHGTWNPYDTHIPLLWYGWNIHKGETNRVTSMTDISATLAALLHIQMPNGCVGSPIQELLK